MAKHIMIILDGIQDIAYDQLEGRTPYDSGKGESFRRVEAASRTGRLVTTPPGFVPDTQTCVLTLLGVEAEDIPEGRSYIEALVQGIDVGDEDIIMRCNFVQVENGILTVPCCGAPPEIAAPLMEAVAAQPGHSIKRVGPYKSLQKVDGGRKYVNMRTNAPHQHAGEPFEDLLPQGNELADSLADFSRRIYAQYRPYTVLNWGQAVKGELPAFGALHPGLSGAVVSKTDAPMGAAMAMGMDCPVIETATGDTDTDLAAKVRHTLDLAGKRDFVMLHIGGPDEATHRQDPVEKARFTEKLDREMLAPLLAALEPGDRLLITCDHEAYCSTAGHTDLPVGFWLYEEGNPRTGDLGELDGKGAVPLLMRG